MLSAPSLQRKATLLFFAGVVGCASAGPDLSGPEGPNFMSAYSGDWVLVPSESEDLNAKMRDSMRNPAGGPGGGGMTGDRGGRGGMPGGGGMRGGGGGMRGGMAGGEMDPEERRRSMEALRALSEVPGEISLSLRPEAITFTQAAANVLVLNLGAGKEEVLHGGLALLAEARWTKNGIEIDRETGQAGGIKDRFNLDENGNLILKREIDLMGRSVKGTLVYQRKPTEN